MTRNNPSTSIDAFRQVTPDMLRGHYLNIIKALQSLGTCNYEKIADFVGMERHAVGRRLKEMEGLQLIYKPGTTSLTKSNRKAFNYCLPKLSSTGTLYSLANTLSTIGLKVTP